MIVKDCQHGATKVKTVQRSQITVRRFAADQTELDSASQLSGVKYLGSTIGDEKLDHRPLGAALFAAVFKGGHRGLEGEGAPRKQRNPATVDQLVVQGQ